MTGESNTRARQVDGTIVSLSFRKTNPPDQELIKEANAFAGLPSNRGIAPTSLLRNFIVRKLKEAVDAAKSQQLAAS